MPINKHITLENQLSELNTLAAAVESFAEQAELDMKTQFNLNLALDELVTNIINYAYDDESVHQIEITLSHDDAIIVIQLTDDGRPFDLTKQPNPELDKELEQREIGGLGIHFIRKLMDKITYQRIDNKNQLTLEKQLHEEGA